MFDNQQENIPPQEPVKQPEVPPVVESTIVPESPKPIEQVWPDLNTSRKKGNSSVLSKLPVEVRKDLETFMLENGGRMTKKYMVDKYGSKYPFLAQLHFQAYTNYKKKHRARMEQEVMLQMQVNAPMKETKAVIDAITDPKISLENKREALNNLFNAVNARRQLLEMKQQNYLDPMIEALILQSVKEQRVIIEKVTQLGEQLSKEADKDFYQEFQQLTSVILTAVYNTFKTVCGNDKYTEFYTSLEATLQATLRNYTQSKANLKAVQSKS